MELTSLIDFAELSSAVLPIMTAAIAGALIIGGSVMAAKMAWRFFRQFTRG